jgi:hypothetical protein
VAPCTHHNTQAGADTVRLPELEPEETLNPEQGLNILAFPQKISELENAAVAASVSVVVAVDTAEEAVAKAVDRREPLQL